MTTPENTADLNPLVSREQAENEFRKGMCLFVGRGRQYSVAQLAKGSGVHHRAIECFKSYTHGHPDYRPLHLGQMMSIASFLGAEFTTEWLVLCGQGAFDLPDANEPDPGKMACENSDDNAILTRAAINGEFEEHESRDLRGVGERMMERGAKLVAISG